MAIDIIAALTQPGSTASVHNVRLIDVQPGDGGYEQLIIERDGRTYQLLGGSKWNEQFSRRVVGRVGYVISASPLDELPVGACYFRDYLDPSLRRVPEFDLFPDYVESSSIALPVVGWRCDMRPGGFRAPLGIIPGQNGQFVPDETISVTLRVPPEFVRECQRVQMTPVDLLRSFVGDVAGIQNFASRPRADRYGSGGSDERDYAEAWLCRAHGMNAISLDELAQRESEAEERAAQCDELAMLLDDFERAGGEPEDFVAAVEEIVRNLEQAGQR